MDEKSRAIAAPFAAAALVGALGTCGVSTAMAQEVDAVPEASATVAAVEVAEEAEPADVTTVDDAANEATSEEDSSRGNEGQAGEAEAGASSDASAGENSGADAASGAEAGEAGADADSAADAAVDDQTAGDVSEEGAASTGTGEISLIANNESLVAEPKVVSLPSVGWTGDAYWDGSVDESGAAKVYTGYVVDAHDSRGLQRYWIQNGYLFRNGLFDSLDGNFGYALKDGCVLRGVYTDDEGNIYLADNDGKLAGGQNGGWVVSASYGQGLQRYWIDPQTHAAKEGFSSDGWAHYTTQDGYVLRGKAATSDGAKRSANNDGLLAESGWLVTSDFGQGLQRYWLEGYKVATSELVHVAEGVWTYARPEGYVVRGSYSADGRVYLADNDGVLAGGEAGGWVVSAAYGQGLQRYWIDSDSHAAVEGYSAAGYAHYTTSAGYVLRGGATGADGSMRYADNDGRLRESGWLVTSALGQGLQRYWLVDYKVASEGVYQTGSSSWTYATSAGYVLRGSLSKGGLVYLADNDGLLAGGAKGGWVVSGDYGQGLQRYWVDAEKHAAVAGFSTDGWAHYTTSAGYVLRGGMTTSNGLLLADNAGRLMEHYATSAGWFISGCMTGGVVQRYYLVEADGHLYAKTGLFSAELTAGAGTQQFYGKPGVGYVSRNERVVINGKTYASNNDGVLKVSLVRIYLDAGHGWNSSYDGAYDGGAEGCGYQEAQLTRELVQLIADIASQKYGLDVVTDNAVNYRQRNQDAYDKGCNYFVSIHFNSGGGTGSESYIHTLNAAPGSSQLQSIMHSKLIEGLGLRDRGKQEERFAVCGGKVPATLLEICFIDNASDMATYQARKQYLAECLAAGLYEYSSTL